MGEIRAAAPHSEGLKHCLMPCLSHHCHKENIRESVKFDASLVGHQTMLPILSVLANVKDRDDYLRAVVGFARKVGFDLVSAQTIQEGVAGQFNLVSIDNRSAGYSSYDNRQVLAVVSQRTNLAARPRFDGLAR